MQRVRISSLRAGQSFPHAVFLPSGQKLFAASTRLTDHHLDLMRRQGVSEVILAEDALELEQAGVVQRVDTAGLQVGQTAAEPLMAQSGQWVLDAGNEIEQHHIDALRAAGSAFVAQADGAASDASPDAAGKLSRRERLIVADEILDQLERELDAVPSRVAVQAKSWLATADAANWPAAEQLTDIRNAAVEKLRHLYAKVEAGVPTTADADFLPIVDDLLARLASHPAQFTQLALLIQRRDDYLADHAYAVAVFAMSIGGHLKWSREDVRALGLAALVSDLGMLLDRARVQKHPLFALSLMRSVGGLPPVVKLAALQHHERESGGGYPRARRKDQICEFARVLAVADAFAAATAPRTFRKKKLPYAVMEEILRAAAMQTFWTPACRALVQSAGLFPVGSYVKLSTGERAHVVGSNAAAVDRPMIRIVEQGKRRGQTLDLAKLPKQELAVVRPIDGDAAIAA